MYRHLALIVVILALLVGCSNASPSKKTVPEPTNAAAIVPSDDVACVTPDPTQGNKREDLTPAPPTQFPTPVVSQTPTPMITPTVTPVPELPSETEETKYVIAKSTETDYEWNTTTTWTYAYDHDGRMCSSRMEGPQGTEVYEYCYRADGTTDVHVYGYLPDSDAPVIDSWLSGDGSFEQIQYSADKSEEYVFFRINETAAQLLRTRIFDDHGTIISQYAESAEDCWVKRIEYDGDRMVSARIYDYDRTDRYLGREEYGYDEVNNLVHISLFNGQDSLRKEAVYSYVPVSALR